MFVRVEQGTRWRPLLLVARLKSLPLPSSLARSSRKPPHSHKVQRTYRTGLNHVKGDRPAFFRRRQRRIGWLASVDWAVLGGEWDGDGDASGFRNIGLGLVPTGGGAADSAKGPPFPCGSPI